MGLLMQCHEKPVQFSYCLRLHEAVVKLEEREPTSKRLEQLLLVDLKKY